jgi:protein-tyrosine phosphatase
MNAVHAPSQFRMTPAPLGTLPIPMPLGKFYTVTGGPSRSDVAQTMTFVKMAAEITDVPCAISIPTRDFSTPDTALLTAGLEEAVIALTSGKPMYVGCMAGKGRTGLFMAVLCKAFGIPNPVEYVREHYYAHAVETKEQYAFVTNFEIPQSVKTRITYSRFWSFFSFSKNLTKPAKPL